MGNARRKPLRLQSTTALVTKSQSGAHRATCREFRPTWQSPGTLQPLRTPSLFASIERWSPLTWGCFPTRPMAGAAYILEGLQPPSVSYPTQCTALETQKGGTKRCVEMEAHRRRTTTWKRYRPPINEAKAGSQSGHALKGRILRERSHSRTRFIVDSHDANH